MNNEAIINAYNNSSKRLLLLDYDGVLTPIVDRPELARPSRETLNLLRALAADPRTTCAIISGRDHETLEDWLGALPLAFAAEHGLWHKELGKRWVRSLNADTSWKVQVAELMMQYQAQLPGSFIEQKTAGVGFHYRLAGQKEAKAAVAQLIAKLDEITSDNGLRILHGKKVVEVIPKIVDKGAAAQHWVDGADWDFILAIGDDVTDEAMFERLEESAYTLKVGKDKTKARYRVNEQSECIKLLKRLVES